MPRRSRLSAPARLAALLVVLALTASACFGDDLPPVQTGTATDEAVTEQVLATGRLAPAAAEEVTAGVTGEITAIEVDDGATVRAGDVVVRLDSDAVDEAREQLDDARAALADLDDDPIGAELDTALATDDLADVAVAGAAPDAGFAAPDLGGAPGFPGAPGVTGAPDLGLGDLGLGDLSRLTDLPTPPNPARPIVADLDDAVRPALAEARAALPEALADLERRLAEARAALDDRLAEAEQAARAKLAELEAEIAAQLAEAVRIDREALPPEVAAALDEAGIDAGDLVTVDPADIDLGLADVDLGLADLELPEVALPSADDLLAAVDAIEARYDGLRAALLEAGASLAGAQADLLAGVGEAAAGIAAEVEAALSAAVGQLVGAQAAAQQAALAASAGAIEQAVAGIADQAAAGIAADLGAATDLGALDLDGLAGLDGLDGLGAGDPEAELAAAEAQLAAQEDALTVTAPRDGILELAEADASAGDGLGGLGDAGGFGGLGGLEGLGGLGDVGVPDLDAPSGGGSSGPVTEGLQVRAGQPLFTVYDLSDWYVEVDVDELDAASVERGQPAQVTLDAFPGQTLTGEVEKIRLAASGGAGGVTYPARIRLDDPPSDPSPRVGMSATAEIATTTVEGATAVPSRAVVRRDDAEAVYVLGDDGTVGIVAVEVLALGDERAAVDGAVAPGDEVVVAGYEDLPDGAEVRVETGAPDGDD